MAEPIQLEARSAFFEGLLTPTGTAHGVVVSPRDDLQIATVIAHDRATMAQKLRDALQIELPTLPKRVVAGDVALLGIGPRTWLALSRAGQLAIRLERVLGPAAAVTDQSSGYAVLRVSGPKARAMFEKGLAVDVHPGTFSTGDVASTTCAHIGVSVWQIDDAPTYEVALFRSYAASFGHWLKQSAAEFGLGVE